MPLASFLAWTLFLPVAIVVVNFVTGALTPISLWPEDDLMFTDQVWRYVQGQHPGTDFHTPLGFGPFELAAILWRMLGPHYYVLRASADLFALVIIFCSCLVAIRQLRRTPGLAALFCITAAFEASGPSVYGWTKYFGMSLFYDRLLMSAFLVLFVQSFTNDLDSRRELDSVDHLTAAFLLNLLFLVKISGLVLGLGIIAAGRIVRGRARLLRGLGDISLVSLFFAAMLAIDFVITGNSFSPVIHEYGLAAQSRAGSFSILDALHFDSFFPVFGVVLLLVVYAVSRPGNDNGGGLWRCLFIIAVFWVCQVALNLSNSSVAALLYLAPAAAVALVTWTDTPETAVFWEDAWKRFDPRRLNEISVRKVIPLVVVTLVALPEALSLLRALKLDYLVSSGTTKTITVTANKGIAFEVLPGYTGVPGFLPAINRAVQAIESLDAGRDAIANVDFVNPFPALFLSPSPKGVSVFWDFGVNVPVKYRPAWQEVIGDACIVTEPRQNVSEPLIDAVRPRLASAFTLVYQDDMWKIWKSKSGCDATATSSK